MQKLFKARTSIAYMALVASKLSRTRSASPYGFRSKNHAAFMLKPLTFTCLSTTTRQLSLHYCFCGFDHQRLVNRLRFSHR